MEKRFLLGPKLGIVNKGESNISNTLTWNPFTFSYETTESVKISEYLSIKIPVGDSLALEKIKTFHKCGIHSYVLEIEGKFPILLLLTPEGSIKEKLKIPILYDGWPLTSVFYYEPYLIITKMWYHCFMFEIKDNNTLIPKEGPWNHVFNVSSVIGNAYFLLNISFGAELCRINGKKVMKIAEIASKKLSRCSTLSGFLDISTLRIFICTDETHEKNKNFIFEVMEPVIFPLENEKYEFKLIQSLERKRGTKFFSFDPNFLYFLRDDKLEVLVWQDGEYLSLSEGVETGDLKIDNLVKKDLKFEDIREIAKGLEPLLPLPLCLITETLDFMKYL